MKAAVRTERYDFVGQSYSKVYPNLHRYPASMLPQIGIALFDELNIKNGKILDPYCGSGSTFSAGLEYNFDEMVGFDINPLAVHISQVKFTEILPAILLSAQNELQNCIYSFLQKNNFNYSLHTPQYKNIDYWFSKNAIEKLALIKFCVNNIQHIDIKRLFLLAFAETARECSYTRNNEFKLFRIKSEDVLFFNPDVTAVFLSKLNAMIYKYATVYYPKLNGTNIKIFNSTLSQCPSYYDVVLTSPPYGDSKTTVAYGQFSHFANEWLDNKEARKVDRALMGGQVRKMIFRNGVIAHDINKISNECTKRAYEVSSFYEDLENSIKNVAHSVKKGGYAIYIVGNRTVKEVYLNTDMFIAESFENLGFEHLATYQRALSNKTMPLQNSPTNVAGKKKNTMLFEHIVICQKKK